MEKWSQILAFSVIVVFVEYLIAAFVTNYLKINIRPMMITVYIISVMFVILTISGN